MTRFYNKFDIKYYNYHDPYTMEGPDADFKGNMY